MSRSTEQTQNPAATRNGCPSREPEEGSRLGDAAARSRRRRVGSVLWASETPFEVAGPRLPSEVEIRRAGRRFSGTRLGETSSHRHQARSLKGSGAAGRRLRTGDRCSQRREEVPCAGPPKAPRRPTSFNHSMRPLIAIEVFRSSVTLPAQRRGQFHVFNT